MDITEYQRRLGACGIENIEDLILLSPQELISLDFTEDDRSNLFNLISVSPLFNQEASLSTQTLDLGSVVPFGQLHLDHDQDQKKRRYRRRPKRDSNAPRLPPSAYVVFTNEYRRDVVEDQTKFVDIARSVGQAWQAMPVKEKSEREASAALLKEEYQRQLKLYKKTENYKTYQQYLQHFKAEVKSKASEHQSALPRQRRHSQRNNETLELEQLLLKLTDLASLSDQESSMIRRTVQASLDRGNFTSQSPQSLPFPEPVQGVDSASKVQGYIGELRGFDKGLTIKSLPEQLAEDSHSQQSPHFYMISPFHLQSESVTKPFLMTFLERVNSVLFLFDETELLYNLEIAYGGEVELDAQVITELCLALAIGVQWCDHGSNETALLWYENGRRFLDDVDWDHEPWVMRAMTLLSIYHLSLRLETARHYLHIGIRIARANDFFVPMSHKTGQVVHHEWLLVWNTIMIIESWVNISPISTSFHLIGRRMDMDVMMQPASVINRSTFGYFCELSSTLRSIARLIGAESLQVQIPTSVTAEKCLEELEQWRASVPESLCHFHPNYNHIHSDQAGSIERMASVNLHMVSLYLGIRMRLSFPSLTKVVDWLFATRLERQSQPDERAVRVAGKCIESAHDYSLFCANVVRQGYFCPNSCLPIKLLFDAAMIGMIARVWHTRALRSGSFDLTSSLDVEEVEGRSIVENARNVLNHCSPRNSTALSELKYIMMLEQFVR